VSTNVASCGAWNGGGPCPAFFFARPRFPPLRLECQTSDPDAISAIVRAKYAALDRLYRGLQLMVVFAVVLLLVGTAFIFHNKGEKLRLKKHALLDHAFSIETGELTPTLKVKRKVVREKYATVISGLG